MGQMRAKLNIAAGAPVPGGLIAAAVFGVIHAGFSVYWSMGGTWLAWSLGGNLQASFQGWEWILTPIGLAKLIAALAPIALARGGWPAAPFRALGVLAGRPGPDRLGWGEHGRGKPGPRGGDPTAVRLRSPGHDRPRLPVGPLFLAWGVALAIGLLASRNRTA